MQAFFPRLPEADQEAAYEWLEEGELQAIEAKNHSEFAGKLRKAIRKKREASGKSHAHKYDPPPKF